MLCICPRYTLKYGTLLGTARLDCEKNGYTIENVVSLYFEYNNLSYLKTFNSCSLAPCYSREVFCLHCSNISIFNERSCSTQPYVNPNILKYIFIFNAEE